jgi:hypothetical protein
MTQKIMPYVFEVDCTNLKNLCFNLKKWSREVARISDLNNVTINYYKKNRVYYATFGCAQSGADERINAFQLIELCGGSLKKYRAETLEFIL